MRYYQHLIIFLLSVFFFFLPIGKVWLRRKRSTGLKGCPEVEQPVCEQFIPPLPPHLKRWRNTEDGDELAQGYQLRLPGLLMPH
jgi:hypothetical protein